MEDIIMLLALGVFVVTLLIGIFVQLTKYIAKGLKKGTVQAEVISKEIKRPYANAKARICGTDWFEYYAVFRTEKGKKLELQMPKEIYDVIEEGDKGQLSFKGYYFISFDKNSCFFV